MIGTLMRIGAPIVLAMVLSAGGALAGGQAERSDSSVAAEKRLEQWRQQGRRAIPAAVSLLCGDEPELATASREFLREMDAPAAAALLRAIDGSSRGGCPAAVKALAEVLCGIERTRDPGQPSATLTRIIADLRRPASVRSWPRTSRLQVLGVVAESTHQDFCVTAKDRVLKPAAPALGVLIESPDGEQKREALLVVMAAGPSAGAAAPQVVALLDSPDFAQAALETIVRLGAAAASAGPKLQHMFATRPRDRVRLAAALKAIGPGGHEAWPDVRARLAELAPAVCSLDNDGEVRSLVEVVEAMEGPDAEAAVQPLEALLRAERSCGRSTLGLAAVKSLSAVRASAASRLLTEVMMDGGRPIALRRPAALALIARRMTLTPDQEATVHALERKRRSSPYLLDRETQGGRGPTPEQATWMRVRAALDDCQNTIPVVTIPASEGAVPEPNPAPHELDAFSDCLESRLCGPKLHDYAVALTTCCQKSFPRGRPAFCRQQARLARSP
jgi:hypothetical protein